MTDYTANLATESGDFLMTEAGLYLLAENTVPITPQPPYPDPVIKPRDFPELRRGVNLSGWYTLHGQNLIVAADVQAIKEAGFDHVRLNIAPGWTDPEPGAGGPPDPVGFGWDATDPTGAIPGIATVDAGLALCLDAGLEVIIDCHTTMTTDNERLIDPIYHYQDQADPVAYVRPFQDSFCEMWKRIATQYKDYPQNAIAYEVINEPQFYGYESDYFDFRNRIVAAIREVDSLHFIITPPPWGGGTGYLWRTESVADSAHGLAIHAYDPFDYTHRLTEWTGISNPRNWVLNFKYPNQDGATIEYRTLYKDDSVTQGDFDAYLISIGYPAGGLSMITDFDAQDWTTNSYDWIADYVADHGIPRANMRMFLNEYGTYKNSRPMLPYYDPNGDNWSAPWRLEQNYTDIDVDEPSRSSYLYDSRQAWERRSIGWTVFDYAGNFGVSTLSGDAYWRDNGEYCPVYGGDWSREFTGNNFAALLGTVITGVTETPSGTIYIAGFGFYDGLSLTINSAATNIASLSNTLITATVPKNRNAIYVIRLSGQFGEVQYTYRRHMTTPVYSANDVIRAAMRMIQVSSSDTDITSAELNDGLESLNRMLDSWSADELALFYVTRESFDLVSGQNPYTIGIGGDFDTTRPIKIVGANLVLYNASLPVTYPMQVINWDAYNAIRLKTLATNIPGSLYYEPAFPLGSCYIYPLFAPSSNSTTAQITLSSWKPLGFIADATEDMEFPPGYWEAFVYNLALRLAEEYQFDVRPNTQNLAAMALKRIKRINQRTQTLSYDPALMNTQQRRYNIYSDSR